MLKIIYIIVTIVAAIVAPALPAAYWLTANGGRLEGWYAYGSETTLDIATIIYAGGGLFIVALSVIIWVNLPRNR